MQYLSCHSNKSMLTIDAYLCERLGSLKGKDREAVIFEFKEWLLETAHDGDEIWSIPDLTDEGLRDFFRRAISRK